MTTETIQIRRDTTANWATANPTLAPGELGLDLTTGAIKMGNGSNPWSTLGNIAAGTVTSVTSADGNATVATTTTTPVITIVSAPKLQTTRAIYGNNFDGTAALTGIIASTYGGTGNGFTKFSGPASSEKTFTLPNANAVILTDNAVVTVAQGGSGTNTFTAGILKANGTSAFTTVTAPSGAIVGTSDSQTLSNKDLTAGTNVFPTFNQDTTGKSAKTDALNSATTVVNVSASAAPSTGYVLMATDSTHATWQANTVSGAAGGSLAGTYPNPTLAAGAVGTTELASSAVTSAKINANAVTAAKIANNTITDSQIASANTDGVAGVASIRTLGTGSQQAAAGNDSRFSDDRNGYRVRAVATSNVVVASGMASGTVVDGVTLVTGDRVLLAGQTTPAENGPYKIPLSGSTGTRTGDLITANTMWAVAEGTTNHDTLWWVTTNNTITLGTTSLTIAQFSAGGGVAWGTITGTLSSQTDLSTALSGKVATTVTVNGHALSSNVTVTQGDVGLGNVDNTSDTTKWAATAALTNKDLTSGTNTFPTLNQNTTGSAAKWTTARNLAGNSVDGSANVAFANKFIVQGTSDSGLSAAQFLGSLGTGIIKNTTTTGVLSIAVAADFPTLNQDSTGKSAKTDALNSATTVVNVSASTAPSTGYVLTATDSTHATWQAPAAGGTVTTVSVVGANGFAGSVANATTTPAITLTTSITGMLKGNGTAISAAVSDTDFVTPLVPTAVKTANYTAVAKDYIPVDTTSGNITVTLPTAPIDGTRIGVKMVIQGGTNTVTVSCGGTDVFNKAGGSTSVTITYALQGIVAQYKSSTGIWYITGGDLGLTALDSRYVTPTQTVALTNKNLNSGTNTFPTFNQNTTGSAATLTTPRAIYGNNFDGSAAITAIIASTYGGTGNGFTKFSGPATSEKTFTLPNASATVLTDSALVTVAQGGTGVGTLTGILKGNGTSAFTTVTAPSGTLVGTTDTQTLTNKRLTPRTFSTTSTATLTPEIDTYDIFHLTAQAAALNIANHSTSTPVDGEKMEIRLLDNGTARAVTYGTNYVAKAGIALPTTTTISKNMTMLFEWNANLSKWNLVAAMQES